MTTSTNDKSLAHFFERIHQNREGNQQRFPERYRIIRQVDDCFVEAGKHLTDAKPIFTGPMYLRSQYAYKTAAGMTLAGQFPESFVMMRSCLEYAGWALLIFADPRLEEVFVNRHVDDASKKAQRRQFEMTNVMAKIASFDQTLSDICKDLYGRCIDFGGHPNPHGMLGTMNIDKDADLKMTGMSTFALTVEPRIIEFSMHKAAQVGLTALYIFQHIFKENFEVSGVGTKMDALKESGL